MRKCFLTLAFVFFLSTAHGQTVICIHGFLSNARTMRPIKNVMQRGGYDVILWEYPSRRRLIEEHGAVLAHMLRDIAFHCPGEPILFVTHSIGALVLRAGLNHPVCPFEAKIGSAVLFTPPSQGSSLARSFQGLNLISFAMGNFSGRQIINYPPQKIAAFFGEFPASMAVLVIAGTYGNKIWFDSPNDGFLTVEETRLNTPHYFMSYPASHGDILANPAALCSMRNFFTESKIQVIRSGPAQCEPGFEASD